MLISTNLKGLMLFQEIKIFNGDYAMYYTFIRSFDNIIASKLSTNSEKLQYLEQFTEGKPHEIVKACLHLEPKVGYKRARELLHKRYGNKDQAASAYLEQVLNWPNIGRDDVEALDEFFILLASCLNAITNIESGMNELQNPKTMRILLQKLPFNMQDRFCRMADDISLKQKVVKFEDLV